MHQNANATDCIASVATEKASARLVAGFEQRVVDPSDGVAAPQRGGPRSVAAGESPQPSRREAQLRGARRVVASGGRDLTQGTGRERLAVPERLVLLERHVRGSFFVEYVRMIRRRKDVEWMRTLRVEDLALVQQRITPEAWYPMSSFERLGLAILANFESAGLDAVRMWGHFSANQFAREHPSLVAEGDPVETLMRLKVQRATLFDFPAFDVPTLIEGHAVLTLSYGMGPVAEEAACHQTLGFCEGVLALAGAEGIQGALDERSWHGAGHTSLLLDWRAR
jgi:hypothetical protein